MKHILLTTDFSENAKHAIDYAIGLWGKRGVRYTLLNSYYEPANIDAVVSLSDFIREESEAGLEREKERLQVKYGAQFSLKTLGHYGDFVAVVNALNAEQAFDFVVLGSKGVSKFERFFLGSNTVNAVKNLHANLLVIPQSAALKHPKHLAFAADYVHMNDLEHIQPMVTLARSLKADVSIVHVSEEERRDYTQALEGFGIHNSLKGLRHDFHTEIASDTLEGIQTYLDREQVDLLALVARKRDFWERLIHRSVSNELAAFTRTPLLILRD